MTEENEKSNDQEETQTTTPRDPVSNNNQYKGKGEVISSTLIYNGFKKSELDADHDDNIQNEITSRQICVVEEEDDDVIINHYVPLPTEEYEDEESSPVDITVTQVQEEDEDAERPANSSLESHVSSHESLETSQHSTVGAELTTVGSSSAAGGGDTNSRRHSKSSSLPHGVKLCPENSSVAAANTDGSSKADETDQPSETAEKWEKLENELKQALVELKAKDDEVEKLKGIRQQVEGELEDLTASLFVEAHKMVSEAKMKEISSEKCLKEAQMQMEGLQAEVAALKALLITSTPSRPNLGGHSSAGGSSSSGNGISIFKKQHKRFPSHTQLQYGRTETETEKEKEKLRDAKPIETDPSLVDPILHRLFVEWRKNPSLTAKDKSPFLQKVYTEDIDPCLLFENIDLVKRLRKAIEENSIWVEPVAEKDKTNIPNECAFLCIPRICHYRLSFDYQSDEWFEISQFCRDRIAAVCEFLNYLRYIKNGLVKSPADVAYWEIIRLRRQMSLAKLGITIQ